MSTRQRVIFTRAEAERIVEQVAELADVAAAKDIDVALMILGNVARSFEIDPTTLATYNELAAL